MRVQGRLDLIQSNLDFYSRLTSTSKHRKVEDLRSFYYNKFLEDARRNLKSLVSSKAEVTDEVSEVVENTGSASSFLSAVKSQSQNVIEEQVCDEQSGTVLGADSFLSAIQTLNSKTEDGIEPVKGICLEDIIADTGYEIVEVHGTFLDDICIESYDYVPETSEEVVEESVEESVEEVVEEVHGIFLEDCEIRVSVTETKSAPVKLEDIHGTILDDIEDVYIESKGTNTEEIEFVEESDDIGFIFEEGEVVDVEPTQKVDNIIPINDKVVVSKPEVYVPPTVREFLKKHPGCEMSEVEKYYPKKTVQKELKMGKIYKKGNKLFI